jgi:hypothetical protein
MPFRLRYPRIKLTENNVERGCLDVLRYRGYRPVRLHSALLRTPDGRWIRVGEPGLPDYVIPKFFVEIKRPRGELFPAQQAKISELAEGWHVETAVVDSVDMLVEWLAEFEAQVENDSK